MKHLGFLKQRLIRAEVLRFLRGDPECRAVIAKCARATAKDYIEDWAELEQQEAWRCPVCGKHECDGPDVHGRMDAEQNALPLESHWGRLRIEPQ